MLALHHGRDVLMLGPRYPFYTVDLLTEDLTAVLLVMVLNIEIGPMADEQTLLTTTLRGSPFQTTKFYSI